MGSHDKTAHIEDGVLAAENQFPVFFCKIKTTFIMTILIHIQLST